jgi:hypothetical protein
MFVAQSPSFILSHDGEQVQINFKMEAVSLQIKEGVVGLSLNRSDLDLLLEKWREHTQNPIDADSLLSFLISAEN